MKADCGVAGGLGLECSPQFRELFLMLDLGPISPGVLGHTCFDSFPLLIEAGWLRIRLLVLERCDRVCGCFEVSVGV